MSGAKGQRDAVVLDIGLLPSHLSAEGSIMKLIHSHSLMAGISVLTLLSACSRPSATSPSPQAGASSQVSQMSRTAAGPESSHPPGELDCPVTLGQQTGETLHVTPKQIDSMRQQLGAGGENEIAAAVTGLRSHHPGASEGEIVNYLITAFCPTIKNRPGMSVGEKQQALRSFATQARKLTGPA